jgi:hypothetical protein
MTGRPKSANRCIRDGCRRRAKFDGLCPGHAGREDGQIKARPSQISRVFMARAMEGPWKSGRPFPARNPSTCPRCERHIAEGWPVWMWQTDGMRRAMAVHHHCARYLAEPPSLTICLHPECGSSTSCVPKRDGTVELFEFCWLHRRREALKKGQQRGKQERYLHDNQGV